MRIVYLAKKGTTRTLHTNNPAVFELLALMGYRVLSVK